MPKPKGGWAKGGVRFSKLNKKVQALAEPGDPIRWWFIGTSSGGVAATSVGATAMLFGKEAALAVTDTEVIIVPMGGPGIVSSKIKSDEIRRIPLGDVEASFDPKSARISVNGFGIKIFPYHEYDALQFVAACGAEMPEWFEPA